MQVFCSWAPHMPDQRRGQTGACSSLREPSPLWGGRGTHVHFLPPAHEIELDAIRGNKCTSLIPALAGHHCRFCGVGSRTGSYSLRRHNQGPSMGLDTRNTHGSHSSNGNTGALFSPMLSSALWGASDNKCTFHCPLLKHRLDTMRVKRAPVFPRCWSVLVRHDCKLVILRPELARACRIDTPQTWFGAPPARGTLRRIFPEGVQLVLRGRRPKVHLLPPAPAVCTCFSTVLVGHQCRF